MHWSYVFLALTHRYVILNWPLDCKHAVSSLDVQNISMFRGQFIGCTEHQHVQGPFSVFNSLAPGSFQWNLRKIIFKLILVTDGCDISSEIALRWTSRYLNDDKPRLVQVMAWCCQATSHYLSHVDLDPCHHMASLGHNELKYILQSLEPLRNDVIKFIYFKIGRFVWQLLLREILRDLK